MPKRTDIGDIGDLPLRALTAFLARCARRARPVYRLPDRWPHRESLLGDVDRAIAVAEAYAGGDAVTLAEAGAASAAAASAGEIADEAWPEDSWCPHAPSAAGAAAQSAARAAVIVCCAVAGQGNSAHIAAADGFNAHLDAVYMNYDAAKAAAMSDLKKLRALRLGHHSEAGLPVDPGEDGPLGRLWPEVDPGEDGPPDRLGPESGRRSRIRAALLRLLGRAA